VSFFRRFGFFFCFVFFLENCTTDDSVSFGFRSGFFVLSFREVGGQCGDLVVV
jgi:hypothetical protein